MKLCSQDLITLSKLAEQAAQKAGEFINCELSKLQKNHAVIEVTTKTAGENLASQVVTQVDRAAQEIILEVLTPSIQKYDLGLLTEENLDNHSRFEKDYFWCIDPLDGTLPFIEQTTGYAISIALVSKSGTAVIGVVFDPTRENLYTAVHQLGVTKNNKPLTSKNNSGELHFIHDRSFSNHSRYSEVLEQLKSFQNSKGIGELKVISHGGAVMNAIWAIENAPACYFKFAKPIEGGGSLWDYAATVCIYKELELWVSSIKNTPLQLNRRESSFMNNAGVLYASDKELAEFILGMTLDTSK